MHLDHAVPQALAHLLGPDWKARLQRTVARVMKGHKLGPRAWTDEQIEAHRKRMTDLAMGKTPWTPERLEMLRRDFPTRPLPELWEALNSLAGPHIASPEAMRKKAEQLDLRRDPVVVSAIRSENMRRIIAERSPRKPAVQTPWIKAIVEKAEPAPEPPAQAVLAPAPPPPTAIPPSDWTALGVLTPAAERDAVEQIMAGVGARQLFEDFGGPSLDWWQAKCERHRKARAA